MVHGATRKVLLLMTDNDRATERMAKVGLDWWTWHSEGEQVGGSSKETKLFFKMLASYFTAQGIGHQSDILRAFAEWWDNTVPEIDMPEYDLGLLDGAAMQRYVKDYLASLAEKPVTDAKEEG